MNANQDALNDNGGGGDDDDLFQFLMQVQPSTLTATATTSGGTNGDGGSVEHHVTAEETTAAVATLPTVATIQDFDLRTLDGAAISWVSSSRRQSVDLSPTIIHV